LGRWLGELLSVRNPVDAAIHHEAIVAGIVVASGFGVFLALAMAIVRRYRFKVLSLVGYVLASVLGLAALALAQSVSILSLGLH